MVFPHQVLARAAPAPACLLAPARRAANIRGQVLAQQLAAARVRLVLVAAAVFQGATVHPVQMPPALFQRRLLVLRPRQLNVVGELLLVGPLFAIQPSLV